MLADHVVVPIGVRIHESGFKGQQRLPLPDDLIKASPRRPGVGVVHGVVPDIGVLSLDQKAGSIG